MSRLFVILSLATGCGGVEVSTSEVTSETTTEVSPGTASTTDAQTTTVDVETTTTTTQTSTDLPAETSATTEATSPLGTSDSQTQLTTQVDNLNGVIVTESQSTDTDVVLAPAAEVPAVTTVVEVVASDTDTDAVVAQTVADSSADTEPSESEESDSGLSTLELGFIGAGVSLLVAFVVLLRHRAA
jgi:predicted component of type VI protein secretion system